MERPVVELQLTGVLPFERSALDVDALEEIITDAFNPLIALVRNLTHSSDFAIDIEEGVNRRVLEEQIVTELLERDARFRGQSEAWAKLVLNIKTLALDNAGPESILEELESRSRLLAAPEFAQNKAETTDAWGDE
ncbi:MAG: hypothetical protein HC802_00775 [Caldilineaceae bacterium]|nr:hypothetical protein [Caldilineaceae bacterium]